LNHQKGVKNQLLMTPYPTGYDIKDKVMQSLGQQILRIGIKALGLVNGRFLQGL
jgi:hypothetical protein